MNCACRAWKFRRSWCIARAKSCTEQTILQKSFVNVKHHPNRNLSNIMVFFALANSAILFIGLPVMQCMCCDHLLSVLSGFVILFLMTINSLDGHFEFSMAAVKICCRTCGRCLVSMQTNALPEGSFFTNLRQRREFKWMNERTLKTTVKDSSEVLSTMLTCLPGYQASQWKWRRHLHVHLTPAPSQKPLRVCHTVLDLHRLAQRQNSRLLPARWSGKLLNPSLPTCGRHSSSTAHVRASVSWCQGAPCCSLAVHHGRQTEFRENHPSGRRYHTERKKQSRVKSEYLEGLKFGPITVKWKKEKDWKTTYSSCITNSFFLVKYWKKKQKANSGDKHKEI